MAVFALSDLHVNHPTNKAAIAELPARPDDWLILAGDLCEKLDDMRFVFETLAPRFKQLVWVPGNHELYTSNELSGEAKYRAIVALCRELGVLCPEDEYRELEPGLFLVPMFLLYDYTMAPVPPEEAVGWARGGGIICSDERMIKTSEHKSKAAWCRARVAETIRRLEALPPGSRTILVNHFPLRRDLMRLYRIPRFVPWCGTRDTEDWHTRYRAEVVVTGHLHMRATDWRDGVRFEEVALGYPRHWNQEKTADDYVRPIWPGPAAPASGFGGPLWHR